MKRAAFWSLWLPGIAFGLATLSAGCSDEAIGDPVDGGTGGGSAPAPLDPRTIAKFEAPLVVPPAMPPEGRSVDATRYEIAVKQFEQQILPSDMPKTTVWGYGRASDPATFHTPSFTIDVRARERLLVKWINGLMDGAGHALPHLLPVDGTLHWANPPGPADMETATAAYTGPVPIVTHVHGAHVATSSDGHPTAWYLPDAIDIPPGFVTRGTRYASVEEVGPGAALFEYPNDRRAETLWFHDHALGVTRLNVQAGLAGFWLIRDDEEDALGLPGPAPRIGDLPGTRYYEIPLAIQDRSFHVDGSLAYPGTREAFDGYAGPYLPDTPVHPVWNPEVFGNTIVVNGNTWPHLDVEARLYRFRVLNGCNARTLELAFDRSVTFHRIGNEGGLLSDAPVQQDELVLGPGERADVIVDFSALAPGEVLTLLNKGPDEPYQGDRAMQDPADPETTGQVMQLRVVTATTQGTAGTIPIALPTVARLSTALAPRDLTLNEVNYPAADIPYEAELGTAEHGALGWDEEVTESPMLGDTEVWRFANLTADVHPIHLHLVMFQVLDRTPVDAEGYQLAQQAYLQGEGGKPSFEEFFTGPPVAARPGESGWKDTVLSHPGEVTRIIATFDIAGRYVWHCHILEHEDNEMMRPFEVLTAR